MKTGKKTVENHILNISYPKLIDEICRDYSDNVAIICQRNKVTYSDLYKETCLLATMLLKDGFGRGNNIAIQLANGEAFVIALFAVLKIGAVPLIIYPDCGDNEVEGLVRTATPTGFISFRNNKGRNRKNFLGKLRERIGYPEKILFEDDLLKIAFSGSDSCVELETEVGSDETALLILSGGSTGTPKIIPRKHGEHISSAIRCAEKCLISDRSVFLSAMPLAHNFNLEGPGLLGTLSLGGTVVIIENATPAGIVDNIREYGVTHTAMIPSLVGECVEYAEEYYGNTDVFEGLECVQLGGAVCTEDVIDMVFDKMHCIPQQIYGMGEGIVFSTDITDDRQLIRTTQGYNNNPWDTIRIIDEEGNDVPVGEYGRVIAKGPGIIEGYYRNHEENERSFTFDGYYMTNDRGCLDQNGYIRISGRLDDMIVRGGEKISPQSIERCLRQLRSVTDAAVVTIADSGRDNKIVGFVIGDRKPSEIMKELRKQGISEYWIPDKIMVIDRWPYTVSNKIDKKELVRLAQSSCECDFVEAGSGEGLTDETMARVASIWVDVLNCDHIGVDSDFILFGGNSIDASKMLLKVNREFFVDIEVDEFYQNTDLKGFTEILKRKIRKNSRQKIKAESKWFAGGIDRNDQLPDLLMFPYAGGSAGEFLRWKGFLKEHFNLLPVVYPSRESRRNERMPESIQSLAEDLTASNPKVFQNDYAIFAHCSGACVAYETVIAARRLYGRYPKFMIVSGSEPPHMDMAGLGIDTDSTDDNIIDFLTGTGLVDRSVADNRMFLDYYLPIIRADLELLGKYKQTRTKKFDFPIFVFCGENDALIDRAHIAEWQKYSSCQLTVTTFEGGHYYFSEQIGKVCREIIRCNKSVIGKKNVL